MDLWQLLLAVALAGSSDAFSGSEGEFVFLFPPSAFWNNTESYLLSPSSLNNFIKRSKFLSSSKQETCLSFKITNEEVLFCGCFRRNTVVSFGILCFHIKNKGYKSCWGYLCWRQARSLVPRLWERYWNCPGGLLTCWSLSSSVTKDTIVYFQSPEFSPLNHILWQRKL